MVWNKSFTVSICVYIREAFWLLLWFGPTVPKTPYSTGYRHKVNSWPRQGHLAHQFHKQLPLQEYVSSKNLQQGILKKKIWNTWNIFSRFTVLAAGSEASFSHSTGRGTVAWPGVRSEEQHPSFQQLLATILSGEIKQHHKLIPVMNHFAFQIDFLLLPSGKPFILCKTGVKHYQI